MPRTPPNPPHVVEGKLTQAVIDWILDGHQTSESNIGSINSGLAELNARDAAEQAARIAGDAANQGGGAGSTSNSSPFSGGTTSGATWVTICTVTLTPSGAGGDYTITVTPDQFINGSFSTIEAPGFVFNGNWRLREELTGGGTEYTLDDGTFTVTYTTIDLEVPVDRYTVDFQGFAGGLLPANEGAQVDIRLEIQSASANELTAPGLSGTVAVVWTP